MCCRVGNWWCLLCRLGKGVLVYGLRISGEHLWAIDKYI